MLSPHPFKQNRTEQNRERERVCMCVCVNHQTSNNNNNKQQQQQQNKKHTHTLTHTQNTLTHTHSYTPTTTHTTSKLIGTGKAKKKQHCHRSESTARREHHRSFSIERQIEGRQMTQKSVLCIPTPPKKESSFFLHHLLPSFIFLHLLASIMSEPKEDNLPAVFARAMACWRNVKQGKDVQV